MKIFIKILIGLVVLIILGLVVDLGITSKPEEQIISDIVPEATKTEAEAVIIKNNIIENEELIDEFLKVKMDRSADVQELNIIQDGHEIKVIYNPGEDVKAENSDENGVNIPVGDDSFESRKKLYGYYTLTEDGELKGEYPLISHHIKRTTANNIVTLYFEAPLIEYTKIQEICTYSLESSNYTKKFDLLYERRKDLGVKDVFNAGEYSVKTFGGDVVITIEGDMAYNLEDALKQKVISPEDILNQAKLDAKYGLCMEDGLNDGGSCEYLYAKHTILKLNTLEGEKDLVIGMEGNIIDNYHKNK